MNALGLLLRIAGRSLVAHRVKSGLVGLILAVGTFLVVFFSSLLASIEAATQSAITDSIAGHLQIYDAKARDPLELFGGMGFGSQDVGEVSNWPKVRETVAALPGVVAVLPMGATNATIFGRNEIDSVLETLREGIKAGDTQAVAGAVARARRIGDALAGDVQSRMEIGNEADAADDAATLGKVSDPAFWAVFDGVSGNGVAAPPSGTSSAVEGVGADVGAQPAMAAVDWLDGHLAPMANDGRLFYLRVIGTDLDLYTEHFDRFYVVKGTTVPRGERGILISDRSYEEFIKNIVAHELDLLHEAVVEDGESIAADPLLQEKVKRLTRQYRRVSFQLDPEGEAHVVRVLSEHLGRTGSIDELLQAFLAVDDTTIAARHALFYAEIAPRILLYEIPVGSDIPLRGFTKSGYIRAVNVKVWGTYQTRGLEKASVEQGVNLVDLETFRELYGKMGRAQMAELDDLRAEVGVATIGRDDAEAALFGGGPVEVAPNGGAAAAAPSDGPGSSDPGELVLNVAVLLDDPSKVAAMVPVVQAALDEAVPGLQVVDWQEAAGVLGQLSIVVRLVLVVSMTIAFGVAMIIVNNAMMMATLDRVPEIGTIRAVGGPRVFVIGLVFAETVLLALLAGTLGAGAAVAAIQRLHEVGIPAVMDALVFLFSGDRLYPVVTTQQVGFGMGVVLFVAVGSAIYPAVLAARVPPVVAMRGKE